MFEIAYSDGCFLWVAGAFERRKYMNLVVHRARHPELRDYIHSAVSRLLPFIKKVETSRKISFSFRKILFFVMRCLQEFANLYNILEKTTYLFVQIVALNMY
jgi:hypothetical protein